MLRRRRSLLGNGWRWSPLAPKVSLNCVREPKATAYQRAHDCGGHILFCADAAYGYARGRLAVPAIAPLQEFAAAGGLMTYGPSIQEVNRQAAIYVIKVLKGARPADLPVMQPTRFELAINLKSAKALGL